MQSALAFAALTTPQGVNERELYENIVEIPQYDSKWLQLLDKENETELVAENFQEFQNLYRPIIQSDTFKNCLEIDSKGILQID